MSVYNGWSPDRLGFGVVEYIDQRIQELENTAEELAQERNHQRKQTNVWLQPRS